MGSRSKAILAAYLILTNKKGEILLSKRKNTGYCDGMWGLVSGHIEEKESLIDGLIREAHEEAGFSIKASELQFGCMIHRNSDDNSRIDVFFVWEPESIPKVKNMEPDKCEELRFFALDQLPETTIPYIEEVLDSCKEGDPYFEFGWEE